MSKRIFSSINTICLIILVLLTSIEIPTFSYSFYNYEYNKNATHNQIGISAYDLETVTRKLMDYMKGDADDLMVRANINGNNREFFNSLEKAHMVDVKNLFQIGFHIRKIALILFIITLLCGFMYKKRPVMKEYAQAIRIGFIGFIVICGVVCGVIFSDFNKYFTIFHEIFFNNDMWQLDPTTDLLINIVPLRFFIDIVAFVVIIFCAISIVLILLSTIYLKYIKPPLGAGKK